jgi:hypothetical protein
MIFFEHFLTFWQNKMFWIKENQGIMEIKFKVDPGLIPRPEKTSIRDIIGTIGRI